MLSTLLIEVPWLAFGVLIAVIVVAHRPDRSVWQQLGLGFRRRRQLVMRSAPGQAGRSRRHASSTPPR
jgi:hypothetical protein